MTRRQAIKRTGISFAAALAIPSFTFSMMTQNTKTPPAYDVIIVGGSYAGLSAAMSLGRSLRQVLIIDHGKPCNQKTPRSHNFITHDGEKPAVIAAKAKEQVLAYPNVNWLNNEAVEAYKTDSGFSLLTKTAGAFTAKQLIFATGIYDVMPDIQGFEACWGKTILHCPYCHGYEVKQLPTGILAHGDVSMHLAQLLSNWTNHLYILSNEQAAFSAEQLALLNKKKIELINTRIETLEHTEGDLQAVHFSDGSKLPLQVLYARPEMKQHCELPQTLGCELTENGLLAVSAFLETTVPGVFACGDNCNPLRAVSQAVAAGTLAGAMVNSRLTELF